MQTKIDFPKGWYRLTTLATLKKNKIYTFNYFDTSFICVQSAQSVQVFDAYCPHLGAHLGNGKISNDLIICPFHGWQYNDAGKCVHIPYCDKIPKKALLKKYYVKVLHPYIYFYFDTNPAALSDEEIFCILKLHHFNELLSTEMSLECFEKIIALAHTKLFNFKSLLPGLFLAEIKSKTLSAHFLITATPITQNNLSITFASSIKTTGKLFQIFSEKQKIQKRFLSIVSEIV